MADETPAPARARLGDMLLLLAAATLRAQIRALQRLFGRSRQAGWGLFFECTVAATRGAWSAMGRIGLPRWRAASEALSPRSTDGLEPREAGLEGVTASWLEPPRAGEGALVYLHGGGYVFGSLRSHGRLIGSLARASRRRTLALEYRLAPEHRYPAALEDSLSTYRQLLASGVPAQRIVLSGDSAGGNLVLVTLLALREAGDPLPAGAVLLSPWVDLSNSGATFAEHAALDYVGKEHCDLAASLYLDGQSPTDASVSPLHADLRGLPPLMIHAGGAETLRDQIQKFAEAAEAAGVDVELAVEPGMVHVWHLFRGLTPQAATSIEQIGDFVRQRTGEAHIAVCQSSTDDTLGASGRGRGDHGPSSRIGPTVE